MGTFREALLAWHRGRSRVLRIRSTREPWAILVAEVMAQQTQIARVDEAWSVFVARFPTPSSLADAPTADVLRAWAGLGYNRRAVALQRAAQAIVRDHAGRVPRDVAALDALPGVGPYTARAVAATAFDEPVAPVDVNVGRVVRRLLGAAALPPRELQSAADGLVPADDPAAWTHASMDLGATVCRARRPACEECPVSGWCASAGRVPASERSAAVGPQALSFERTSRWLRGYIVARLREADDGTWTHLPSTIGEHGPEAIDRAVAGLRRDGLLELGPEGSVRLPSSGP